MKIVLATIGTISFIAVLIVTIVMWYGFKSNCNDYLKLSGDAPTIERADEFLTRALQYMEKENLMSGNSAFFFHTPENDVGIWFQQIKGAKETTDELLSKVKDDPGSVSQLEKDNALMKIREVVLDEGKSSTVTAPKNISWFPYQWLMLIWWVISVSLTLVGWLWVVADAGAFD